ncbi:glycosyltransferase family 4 protein [Streptomyces radicis]|uniref:glycosyltransferase family 4 protein n=1 Tax=Streptomyces radicis TaxID=1750517 RepID=UPI001E51B498|nr:glycosyltransferase family 4 protein [Streptomyces radicis]
MKPLTVAFVLLTYNTDEPAGIERSVASLAEGMRAQGHRTLIVAAGPATGHHVPGLVRLASIRLPRPAVEADLTKQLTDTGPVERELHDLLTTHRVDLVCWVDAVWGLGYLAPAPPGVATALMVHVLRTDEPMHASLAHHPAVITVSDFLLDQAADAGLDTTMWQVVPNALLHTAAPPSPAEREELRRAGPVRIVARAEPHKGTAELLRALPAELGREVEIVLAPAGFEYWPGMQEQVLDACRELAADLPQVRLLPALPWHGVQPFLARAAVTAVASTSPETFGNVAAEALSVGTPVMGYELGHLPALTGPAGRLLPLADGPDRLWRALDALLADRVGYHAASCAAPGQVAAHTPIAVAQAFLDATVGVRR